MSKLLCTHVGKTLPVFQFFFFTGELVSLYLLFLILISKECQFCSALKSWTTWKFLIYKYIQIRTC